MIKQLIAFALAAGVSMSASAGYVQYGLQDVKFNDGGSLIGAFVQDTETRAIVFYEMQTGGANFGNQYFVSGSYANLSSVHTNFHGPGPTGFESYVNVNDMALATLNLDFGWNAQTAQYTVQGKETSPLFNDYGSPAGWTERWITGGTLAEQAIDPGLLAAIESGQIGINHMVPTLPPPPASPVPEPGSLALLAAGALALFRLGRRTGRA